MFSNQRYCVMFTTSYLPVVVPVDVPGRPLLPPRVDEAGEVDGAAGLDEQLLVPEDGRAGL